MSPLNQHFSKEIVIFLGGVLSFLVTYLLIPVIIKVVQYKKLMDMPNQRSSHLYHTPTMGGITFYISFILLLFYASFFYKNTEISISMSTSLMILFFIGLKDDLIALSAKVKFISQILAAIILLTNFSLVPYSCGGFLGIGELPHLLGILLGCFIVLSIVNSFNLIDGINGSASIVGITIFLSFSYLFYKAGEDYYTVLSLSSIGFLLAFLRYNLSKKFRIFMGDTGSLVVGLIISLFVLHFLALPDTALNNIAIKPSQKIIIILAILFIPFFDTFRVFIIRLLKDCKPFKPDRNHIHHIMIDYMNLSHGEASVALGVINIVTFIFFYILGDYVSSLKMLLIFIVYMVVASSFLFYFNKNYTIRKKKKMIRDILNRKGSN